MTTNHPRRASLLGVSTLVLAALGAPLAAAAQAPAGGAAEAVEIEAIVVTARKQSENILDAPLSITALGAEQLRARGIDGYTQMNSFVPNFRFQEQGTASASRSYFTLTTRGIFPGSAAPERQGTSIFLDGVPIGGGGTIPGLTDVERVEVVNGPQSAYFGRSTFSGAVNFITRAPGNTPRADISVDVATHNNHEYKASLEGAIVPDVLTARLSVRDFYRGGQYENFGYGGKLGKQTTKSIGLSALFTPVAGLEIRGYATAWRDRDGASATGMLFAPDYNCNAGAAPAGQLNYICGEISSIPANRISQNTQVPASVISSLTANNRVTGSGFLDEFGVKRDGYQTYLAASYEMENGFTLDGNFAQAGNVWTAILDNGFRFSPNNATFLIPYDITATSAEVRLASPRENRLNFLVGANWFKQRTYAGNVQNKNGVFSTASNYNLASTDTLGFFGALSYDVTDRLTLSLEGRAQLDRVRQDVLTRPGVEADGETWSYTPRVIAQYELADDVEIYASYAEGTRPVQFNTNVFSLPAAAQAAILAQAPVQLKVDEELLKMWEAGIKGEFFDRRLRVLASAYYGKWTDRQIQVLLAYPNGPGFSTATVVLPDGEVELYGLELQGQFRATRELTLETTLGIAETDIKNTSCADCRVVTGNNNPVGNRLPRYPAVTGTFSTSYERPAFADYDAYIRADYIYTGKIYDTEANTAWIAPSHRVNLRGGVRNGRYRVELYAVNLFNDDTPTGLNRVADTYNSTNTINLAPPEKRTVGIVLS
ncbi:MAG: TonB-dependent receptor, partial [Phenylobacterium sp.]|nr:TonB-dependent receptor [Phenylobacterium sp.]